MMKRVLPLLLLLLLSVMVGWAQERKPLPVSDLPNIEVRPLEDRAKIEPLKMGDFSVPEKRGVIPPERPPLQVGQFPEVQHRRVVAPEISAFIGPQLPRVELLRLAELKDFKGGMDLSRCKTKVPANRAIYLMNALWGEDGEMHKRPEHDTLVTTPEEFNMVYRYYQQDGDYYWVGGSDTALYFWHEDSTSWTHLASTEGVSGRWDATAYQDMLVATHEGISPIIWDGDTVVSMGGTIDSFQVAGYFIHCESTPEDECYGDSIEMNFLPEEASWETNQWAGYVLGYWTTQQKRNSDDTDTSYTYDFIMANTANTMWIRSRFNAKFFLGFPTSSYVRIYSFFQIDSIWREGTLTRSDSCAMDCWPQGAYLIDTNFTWDSTLNYNDWVFEVTSGTGEGIRTYLSNWNDKNDCNNTAPWSDSGFPVATYTYLCFDSTTEYRIYAMAFAGIGSKFAANFDGRLWLGWTGIGEEQNKNRIIYSALADEGGLGNWPSENNIWIESDDGDYLTGLIQFYPDQQGHRDEPWAELVATKNQSLYRIYPVTYAGEQDYATMFISRGVGCCSNLAMAMIEGKFIAFPDQHGVWLYNGTGVQPISLLIDPIFEDLALANLEDMSAIYNPQDRHYYLSGPELFDEAYPGGEFICVFEMDSAQSKDGFYVHHFDSEGNEVGDDLWQFYYSAGDYLDIGTKSDGEYAIMYKRSSGGTGYKVFMAFFDEDGAQIGDTLRLDDGGEDTGYAKNADHKFAMNGAGQIIACWTDTEDSFDDVRCQCVDFDIGLVGGNFNVNSDHASNIDDYVSWGVGINEEGVAVMTWQDQRDVANITEIYAQRFQYPDSLMGSNFRVNKCWTWSGTACVPCAISPVCDGANCCENELKPVVAVGPRTFVIAWVSSAVGPHARCAGASCLYKRAYNNNDGCAREDEYLLSDCSGGNVQEPSISINSKGRYVVAYDKECGDGATYAIYMTAFDSSDGVRIVETQVSSADELQQGPDVVINNNDIIVVVWYDGYHDNAVEIAYRSYDWNGALMASDAILSSSAYCQYPEIDCFLNPPDTSLYTLAWNIDYHGWSKESFSASAYCYQHGLTDPVKVIFAESGTNTIQNYDVQAGDGDDPVILTYQSPYMSFTEYPYWENFLRYVTVEAYLDTGTIYLDFYTDYSTLVHQDSIMCGVDCREEIQLPDSVYGKNLSMKVTTGSEIETFYLSRYWLEYNVKKERD